MEQRFARSNLKSAYNRYKYKLQNRQYPSHRRAAFNNPVDQARYERDVQRLMRHVHCNIYLQVSAYQSGEAWLLAADGAAVPLVEVSRLPAQRRGRSSTTLTLLLAVSLAG